MPGEPGHPVRHPGPTATRPGTARTPATRSHVSSRPREPTAVSSPSLAPARVTHLVLLGRLDRLALGDPVAPVLADGNPQVRHGANCCERKRPDAGPKGREIVRRPWAPPGGQGATTWIGREGRGRIYPGASSTLFLELERESKLGKTGRSKRNRIRFCQRKLSLDRQLSRKLSAHKNSTASAVGTSSVVAERGDGAWLAGSVSSMSTEHATLAEDRSRDGDAFNPSMMQALGTLHNLASLITNSSRGTGEDGNPDASLPEANTLKRASGASPSGRRVFLQLIVAFAGLKLPIFIIARRQCAGSDCSKTGPCVREMSGRSEMGPAATCVAIATCVLPLGQPSPYFCPN